MNLTESVTQFENQIHYLQEDIDRYKKKEGAKEYFIKIKEDQIQNFTDIKNSLLDEINQQDRIIKRLEGKNFKLEGICLLHGISDFLTYLKRHETVLVSMVKDAFENNWRQTPFEVLNADYPKQKEIKTSNKTIVSFADLKKKAQEDLILNQANL